MSGAWVFSPLQTRWTTLAMVVALLAFGLASRHPWRGPAAVLAYFFGFEVAYWLIAWRMHAGPWPAGWATAPLSLLLAWFCGCRLERRFLLAAVVLLATWVLEGFHANLSSGGGFSPLDELLNESVKVSWGLAWLLPLLGDARRRRRSVMVR